MKKRVSEKARLDLEALRRRVFRLQSDARSSSRDYFEISDFEVRDIERLQKEIQFLDEELVKTPREAYADLKVKLKEKLAELAQIKANSGRMAYYSNKAKSCLLKTEKELHEARVKLLNKERYYTKAKKKKIEVV